MRILKMEISKEGVILLYDNEYKEKENQPDLKAIGNFEGKQVEVAFWKNTDPEKKYKYGGKISQRKEMPKQADNVNISDDDLPF